MAQRTFIGGGKDGEVEALPGAVPEEGVDLRRDQDERDGNVGVDALKRLSYQFAEGVVEVDVEHECEDSCRSQHQHCRIKVKGMHLVSGHE